MWGLPEAVSTHAADVDGLISVVHWFMLALLIGWGAVFLFCLVRFRASKNPKANYYGLQGKTTKYVELGVVVFEAVLLLGFAVPLWNAWVTNFPSKKEALSIRVVAEQFSWNFHYAGPDGEFGKTDPSLIDDETNAIGLDRKNDPNAVDDVVTKKTLYIPKNTPIVMFLTSKDVIHSFKVVAFRVTQDAIPGLDIPISFEVTKEGTYELQCAQLCGNSHYGMKGYVNVKSQGDFKEWMDNKLAQLAEDEGEEDDFW